MKMRMAGRDLSLDAPLCEDGSLSRLDFLPSANVEADEELIRKSEQQMMERAIDKLRPRLNPKETTILERRLLAEEPVTLQEIGDVLQISRERVRQIEESVKRKLKSEVESLMAVKSPGPKQ